MKNNITKILICTMENTEECPCEMAEICGIWKTPQPKCTTCNHTESDHTKTTTNKELNIKTVKFNTECQKCYCSKFTEESQQ